MSHDFPHLYFSFSEVVLLSDFTELQEYVGLHAIKTRPDQHGWNGSSNMWCRQVREAVQCVGEAHKQVGQAVRELDFSPLCIFNM